MSSRGELLFIAVPAAMGAAASFGVTGPLQNRATKRVPSRQALRPGLLIDLAHQPLWVLSIVATVVGSALQVVALDYGPLILVQPLLVTGLLFAVVISAGMARRRPDRIIMVGSSCCVAGLAAFLLVARPTPGKDTISGYAVFPLGIGLAAVLALCLGFAARHAGRARVLALALATGVVFGVTAGLVKVVVGQLRYGLAGPFQSWTLYAVCVIGPLGFLLSQNTYQAGQLVSPALAVITTVDPLVGIGIGLLWLDERLRATPGAVVGEVLSLAVMTAGIVALAHRADHIRTEGGDPLEHTHERARTAGSGV
jgi:drug/metabolite transporter (DMT)-like permease